jgi:hypothetical protein
MTVTLPLAFKLAPAPSSARCEPLPETRIGADWFFTRFAVPRMVVVPAFLKEAVTSVARPGAFQSDGLLSSGVPKVSVTVLPPPIEVVSDSRTVADLPVEVAVVFTRTTPFS